MPASSSANKHKRGIYLIPNLLTTFGFISGFFSIILSIEGSYYLAIMAIFVAVIFDLFDGKIARLTKSNTDFGAYYDSLSDLLSFGIAPAILVYFLSVHLSLSPFVAVFYAVCINLRLARFNTQIRHHTKHFQGLPSPAAALCIASFALLILEMGWSAISWVEYLFLVIALLIAALSVSNFRYANSKELNENVQVRLQDFVPVVLAIILIFWKPTIFMPLMAYGYLLYGVFSTLREKCNHRMRSNNNS